MFVFQTTPKLKEIHGCKVLKLSHENQNKSFAPQKPMFHTILERPEIGTGLARQTISASFSAFNLSIDDLQFLSFSKLCPQPLVII